MQEGVDGGEFFMLELSASLLTSPHGGFERGGGGDLKDLYSKLFCLPLD